MDGSNLARRMWAALEPYHALVYFAPEARTAYEKVGLKGFWMGYFASRSAAMGAVPPEVVTATFFNFHPARVARAIPDAWHLSTPARVLEARRRIAHVALRRVIGDELDSPAVPEAAELARRAAEACPVVGRPLFAGHAALPWPDGPHLALWHALTLLREFRGDGHIAALVAAGLDGCEAAVTHVVAGGVPRDVLQSSRGWSDAEWAGAEARLSARGLLELVDTGTSTSASFTPAGAELREDVECQTDVLAMAPWDHIGRSGCDRLLALVLPLSRTISRAGAVPTLNPMGSPAP